MPIKPSKFTCSAKGSVLPLPLTVCGLRTVRVVHNPALHPSTHPNKKVLAASTLYRATTGPHEPLTSLPYAKLVPQQSTQLCLSAAPRHGPDGTTTCQFDTWHVRMKIHPGSTPPLAATTMYRMAPPEQAGVQSKMRILGQLRPPRRHR